MMINRRNTKEEEDECCSRQPLKLRTATVSLLSVVCLVAVLGSSAITGALAQQSKTAYDGAADEDLQVNTLYTFFISIEKEKRGFYFSIHGLLCHFSLLPAVFCFRVLFAKCEVKATLFGYGMVKDEIVAKFHCQTHSSCWDWEIYSHRSKGERFVGYCKSNCGRTEHCVFSVTGVRCRLCPELNWRVYCKGKKNKLGMTGF